MAGEFLEHFEAALLLAMGFALVALGVAFVARRRVLDVPSSLLLILAGLCAVVWKGPLFIGLSEDEFAWVELAETLFFFVLAASVFLWASSLLSRHADALEHSLERERLLADVLSHDVLNQLAVALPNVDLVRRRTPNPPRELAEAQGAVRHASEIIESALLLLRIEGEAARDPPRADLRHVLGSAVEAVQPLAQAKGVRVEVVAGPAAAAPVTPLFGRAVENLVSNAVKWSPAEGRVRVAISASNGTVSLSVADEGPGIPADRRARLFSRFGRVGSDGVKGVGLGLAIAKRIVEGHRGTLRYEDAPGGGACFVIDLPATRTPQATAAPRAGSAAAAPEPVEE